MYTFDEICRDSKCGECPDCIEQEAEDCYYKRLKQNAEERRRENAARGGK